MSNMYILWQNRVDAIEHIKNNPNPVKLACINPKSYSIDEKDKAAKVGLIIADNHYISSRNKVSNYMMQKRILSLFKNLKWNLLESTSLSFIMPSNPCVVKNNYIDVNAINKILVKNAKRFYFANCKEVLMS